MMEKTQVWMKVLTNKTRDEEEVEALTSSSCERDNQR